MKHEQVKTENMETDCDGKIPSIVNNPPTMNQLIREIFDHGDAYENK
jgi:hypothetical protein